MDTAAALEPLVVRMQQAGRIALDTEADSLHHYYEKVCLVQLSFDHQDYIVDPLAAVDLSSFLCVLADKPLILHGADYDLRLLRASLGFRPQRNVFDTMLAAQLLGYTQFSLPALADRLLGVPLSKRGQKSNWATRPLTRAQLDYANDDTRHLEALADRLKDELGRLGRCDWHRQTCERMVQAAAQENHQGPTEAKWRVKGSSRLDRRQLAYLRQLWHWREREAQEADRPPFKIMGDQPVLELAIWASAHPTQALEHGPKLPRHCTGRRLAALRDAVRQAQDLPESAWPQLRRLREPARPEPCYQAMLAALVAQCARVAGELGIDPAVLAPRATLAAIARHRPGTVAEMMACAPMLRWQADLLEPQVRPILQAHNT